MKKLETGTRVVVEKQGRKYEGIVLPSNGFEDADTLVLKLDNGYNIGIKVDSKTKVTTLGKGERVGKAESKQEYAHSKQLEDIAVLSTGGTVASRIDYETGGVKAEFSAEDLVASAPELKGIANIHSRLLFNLMSEDLTVEDWKQIASGVEKEVKAGRHGVIITHGTDTMHYSSAALSFMLQGLGIPVVLTGAQRSSDRGSSDSFQNLACSARMAVSNIAEVQLCMHGSSSDDYCHSHRGTRARKMHSSRRDAFQSINSKPLAKVWPDGKLEYLTKDYAKRGTESKLEVLDDFEERVGIVYAYPNMNPNVLEHYLDDGYKGIVIMGTGLGHVPTVNKKKSLIPLIKKASKDGVPVVVASQTINGRTHEFVYSNLRTLYQEAGAIPSQDMTPETAYVKLMWVLGQTKDYEKAKALMLQNLRGEISPHTDHSSFKEQSLN